MQNFPISKVIGTTGATGAQNFAGLITAQNAAVATAVAGASGATGFVLNTIHVSPATMTSDTGSGILEMIQTVTYVVSQ